MEGKAEGAWPAMSYFGDLIQTITERGRGLIGRGRTLAERRSAADLVAEAESLLSGKGEASGVLLARDILDRYRLLSPADRRAFLGALADAFGPDGARLDRALAAYVERPSPTALMELHRASEPRRQELIRRLNLAPGGTAALVRMREDLIDMVDGDEHLAALDADFVHLFGSWFNRGFLVLRRIDWTTPANILEKIIRYEAVHQIQDWDDLRRRLEPVDRRLYAFFHPQLVDDPLIFVEVALTRDIPEAIGPLLQAGRAPLAASKATTAVFYSISNCQRGLNRISFGNFLIKQVVDELRRELPGLRTFVTLSPVPAFRAWLAGQQADEGSGLTREEREALDGLLDPAWSGDEARTETLRRALLPLAADYFLRAKTASGRPADPVARFHLGNGARLERINWPGDRSAKAMAEAAGLMVNYLYDLDAIVDNHEAFANEGRVVASPAVRRLLRPERRDPAPRTPPAAAPA